MKKNNTPSIEKNPVNDIFGGKFDIQKAKQRIKELRIKKGLTHKNCADACNMSRVSYTNAENSNSSTFFTVSQLYNLRFVLDTTMSYIFDGLNAEEVGEVKRLNKIIEELKSSNDHLEGYVKTLQKLNSFYEKEQKQL